MCYLSGMKLIRFIQDFFANRRKNADSPVGSGLSRRQFAGAALGMAALPGAASGAALDLPALAALPRGQLALIIRNLAGLNARTDPVLQQDCQRMIADIGQILPEAEKLLELHRLYRPMRQYHTSEAEDARGLSVLHDACLFSRPVSFDYTDLKGQKTSRRVLPIEIVHPATGIQLLAWCEKRQAHRKFFVKEIHGLRVHAGDFSARRADLIQGAIDERQDWEDSY